MVGYTPEIIEGVTRTERRKDSKRGRTCSESLEESPAVCSRMELIVICPLVHFDASLTTSQNFSASVNLLGPFSPL